MGKISQNDAGIAANKIVEPINKKMKEIEDQIQQKVTEYVTASVPADVMKVFKSNKCDYISTTKQVNLKGHGFNGRNVTLIGQAPVHSTR